MRTFAMTGIETVRWIASITPICAMRATPPSLRMSAGTRSSAITAAAPASSAIFACSGVVTSMITPPFSISARPTLSSKVVAPCRSPPFFFWLISLLLAVRVAPALSSDRDRRAARCAGAGCEPLAHHAPEAPHPLADRVLVGLRDREAEAPRRPAVVVELEAGGDQHAGAERVGVDLA